MPLIAINAFQVLNKSGTGYYSRKLIEHVPFVGRNFRYLIFLPSSFKANPLCQKLNEASNVDLKFVPVGSQVKRIFYEQFVMPRLLLKAGAELLHSLAFVAPRGLPMKSVVTVHDLAYRLFPETLTGFRRWYLRKATERSIQEANRVILVSEVVKSELVKHLGVRPERLAVTHEGGFDFDRPISGLDARQLDHLLGWSGDFILFIGTMEPRKNLERLLSAFAILRRDITSGLKLVIAGRKGWLNDGVWRKLRDGGIERDVVFTGFLPDSFVVGLMKSASLYVMPSLYEGFGLPLVTAMRCGTPIVASNAGSIPEVIGDAGILFDPYDVDEMAKIMGEVLNSPGLRQKLVKKGSMRCREFNWEKCARETVAVYEGTL